MPDDIQERKKYFRKIAVARKKAFLKTLPFDFTQRGVFKNIILWFCKLWLCTKTANQLMKEVEERIDKNNDSSLFVCNLVMGNGFGSEFRREVIEDTCEVEFEGKMYKTMAGYDEYLRKTYGDYMKLPPESKRNTFHVWEAYYK